MKIYLAGTPAGWSDHVSLEDTELRLFRDNDLRNRLTSFFYKDIVVAAIEGKRVFERSDNDRNND